MPRRPTLLGLTALETRDVPAVFAQGDGWADARNLTLSFAPDGTAAGAAVSNLNAAFDAVAPRAVWQREVLRAFQSWAVHTNVNVGLVADDGSAFGTPGEFQGDARFGDIRVGGRPLSDSDWANAALVDRLSGTWAGDVLFNTAARFGVGADGPAAADIYSIALHEVAHVLGMDHSVVPGSGVSEVYEGRSAGPSLTDVVTLQALHGGPRKADKYEGVWGNNWLLTATELPGDGRKGVTADLTTAADVDVYKFKAATNGRFTLRLQTSGLSLLTPKVTITNLATGKVVASAASVDPTGGDLEVRFDFAVKGTTYAIRVEGASGGVFDIGRYHLSVVYDTDANRKETFERDKGDNDTLRGATELVAAPALDGLTGRPALEANGVIETPADADHYVVTAPFGATPSLVVTVRSMRADRGAPAVALFDAAGKPLAADVLADRGDEVVVRLPVALPGSAYYIRVGGDGQKVGNYRLSAEFRVGASAPNPERARLMQGYLTPETSGVTTTLTIASDCLYRFALGSAQATAGAAVTLTVRDAAGNVVATLTQRAGEEAVAQAVYLCAGEYTLTLTLSAPPGSVDPKMFLMLDGQEVSNPAGTYQTTTSTGTSTSTGTTTTSGSTTTASKPTTSTSTTRYAF